MVSRKVVYLITASVCIVASASFWGINYFINLQKYKNTVKSISISNVDLSKISDGTYSGSFDALRVSADVSVKINNHKITDIELLNHKNEKGKNAEIIPQRVIDAQSLDVDTVSGATNSSKVILKAIENALNSQG
ncbi:MAG: FMN-binding protein [Clostridiaceae bacterium]